MTTAQIAARFADRRPGMVLVDYSEVGLPAWQIFARCDILAPKAISAIEETAMQAIALGVDTAPDLGILLGLDPQVMETTLTGLVANEWAQDGAAGALELSEAGAAVLAAASEIVPREQVVPLDWDGLLRRPILDQRLVDRRHSEERGLREVPAHPERPPDVNELRVCRGDIARVLREEGSRRDQDSQLLAVRSIDRRERQVLPALALVFAPEKRGKCEIAFAVGDELSLDHETAFVNAGLLGRIGLGRQLSNTPRTPLTPPGPPKWRDLRDTTAESEARGQVDDIRERLANQPGERDASLADALRGALTKLNELPARMAQPSERDALLLTAIASSRRRLLIAGGVVTSSHVDRRMLDPLRKSLDSGTLVRVVVAGAAAGSENALKALTKMDEDYENFILEEEGELGRDGVLLTDDRFVAFGACPWLGLLGDPKRSLADSRSLIVRDTGAIEEVWQRLDGRARDSANRRRRRRRHRGKRSRPDR